MAAARPPVAGPSGGSTANGVPGGAGGGGAPASSAVYGGALMDLFTTYLILNLQDESRRWKLSTQPNFFYATTIGTLSFSFPEAKNREWKDGITALSQQFKLKKPGLMAMSDMDFLRHIENIMTDVTLDDNNIENTWISIAKMFKQLFLAAAESIENGQISRAIMMPSVAYRPWRSAMIGPCAVSLETYLNRPGSIQSMLQTSVPNKALVCGMCRTPKNRLSAADHSNLWRGKCSTCPSTYWCLHDGCDREWYDVAAKGLPQVNAHFHGYHSPPPPRTRRICNNNACGARLVPPMAGAAAQCATCKRHNCVIANCTKWFTSANAVQRHKSICRLSRH